jgi:putative transport protein
MSDIALTVSVLALVAVVGLWIGNIKIRGVGFGIGGVLFGGIIVGHFVDQAGMTLSGDMLHFIQEFGLILFVYTIGIQVGPGFFASLRVSGLRLNLFAVLIVIMGGLVTAILHKIFAIPLPWYWVYSPGRSPIPRRWVPGSKFCAIWVRLAMWLTRWG